MSKKVARTKKLLIYEFYHFVKEAIRNPRNTVSSRSGARTPVIPTKKAVLITSKKVENRIKLLMV
jgi:hypothetical protein